MASSAGSLRIDVTAQIAGLKSGMTKAGAIVSRFKRDVDKQMSSVKNAIFSVQGAVLGLAGVGGLGALIVSGGEYADQLGKTANKLGITTEALQAMHYAGGLAGIGVQEMESNLVRMTNAVQEARDGTGAASKTFKDMGLNIKELAGLAPDKQFEAISEAMGGLGSQSKRVSSAIDIFGKAGSDMLTVMAGGKNVLSDARKEIEALGIGISAIESKKIENANDAIGRVGSVIKGLGEKIMSQLAPYIEYVSNKFLQWVKDSGGVESMVTSAMSNIKTAIGWVITAVDYLNIGWETLRLGVLTFATVTLGALDKVGRAAHWLANLIGEDTPYAWEALTSVVEGFESAMIDSNVKLMGLIGGVGQNAAITKTALVDIAKASEDSAARQVAAAQSVVEQKTVMSQAELDSKIAMYKEMDQADLKYLQLEWQGKQDAVAREIALNQQKVAAVKSTLDAGATLMTAQSKKLFKLGKASAIASALINSYEAITKTMASVPYPFNIPLAIAQGLAGAVQVQNIKSQQFSGAREFGGPVVKGRPYLVGERGPEIITPNASGNVTSNKDIGGGGDKMVNVNITTLDTASVAKMFKENRQMLYNTVMAAMNEDGRRFA